MTTINTSFDFSGKKKARDINCNDKNHSIKKRLLEKYKPSGGISALKTVNNNQSKKIEA